jgi:DNA polymerase-3 subunit delta
MKKQSISLETIIDDLNNKIFQPIYFLSGEEPYFIDMITAKIEASVLTEPEKAFNQTILYGKDCDFASVINIARRYPMMAGHNLVILKEAQELKDFDKLVHYFEHPLKSTILVINYKYKDLDRRKSVFKSLEKNALIYESEKLYEEKIPGWISKYLGKRNYNIEPKAAVLLTEFIGNDLGKLAGELEKLIIIQGSENRMITSGSIEKNIGISKEYNNYELQSALARRDILKTNRIINYFAGNQRNNHISQTISSLYFFFSKLLVFHHINDKSRTNAASALKINPYFVSEYEIASRNYPEGKVIQIISLLREYDVRSKGYENVSSSTGDLLKELIYKMTH